LVLIDLFLHYPTQLGSLNNFAVTQIYKFLKKQPLDDANIVFLLAIICENPTKLDLDDKFQQKLLKLAQKNVVVDIEIEREGEETKNSGNTLWLKKNYFLVLKNVLILSVSTHYEHLLSVSTTASSSSLLPS
ncbi:TPA: hypothetical protein M5353_004608, partial [Salmonella enterica subsp. enterica serovar Typhi str. CT18]|nr:hypothetical protein [Salmonella enterica subsp. enterica serovar Typhi str. CT18]